MKIKKFASRFLEELADTLDSLNSESNSAFFNPSIGVLSTIILTGTAAFSHNLKTQALIFLLSIVLIIIYGSSLSMWVKFVSLISVWAFIVSAPLPFITFEEPLAELSFGLINLKVSLEGVNSMVRFIIRVTVSAAIFAAFIFNMGWRMIIVGLEKLRMPKNFSFLLNLTIISIPLFLRESLKMLSAREARIMRKATLKGLWRILATITGDLLIKSYERSWKLEKSLIARRFAKRDQLKATSTHINIKDLILLSLALTTPLLEVFGWL